MHTVEVITICTFMHVLSEDELWLQLYKAFYKEHKAKLDKLYLFTFQGYSKRCWNIQMNLVAHQKTHLNI